MELSRIQKFVNEHVDASLPAESQTLILGSDMDLMGGANKLCINKDTCLTTNWDCINKLPCGGVNEECIVVTNEDRDKCK